jgi:hypothetical protein
MGPINTYVSKTKYDILLQLCRNSNIWIGRLLLTLNLNNEATPFAASIDPFPGPHAPTSLQNFIHARTHTSNPSQRLHTHRSDGRHRDYWSA